MIRLFVDERQHVAIGDTYDELKEYLFDLPKGKSIISLCFTEIKVELFENTLVINYVNKPEAIIYHIEKDVT